MIGWTNHYGITYGLLRKNSIYGLMLSLYQMIYVIHEHVLESLFLLGKQLGNLFLPQVIYKKEGKCWSMNAFFAKER